MRGRWQPQMFIAFTVVIHSQHKLPPLQEGKAINTQRDLSSCIVCTVNERYGPVVNIGKVTTGGTKHVCRGTYRQYLNIAQAYLEFGLEGGRVLSGHKKENAS